MTKRFIISGLNRTFKNKTIIHSSSRAHFSQSSIVATTDHHPQSSTPETINNDKQEEAPLVKLFKPFPTGRKYIHLAQELQQRSSAIIKIEKIQLDDTTSTTNDQEETNATRTKNRTKLDANYEEENAREKKSRRKIRKNFDEDPEFPFERKRGKRHIMAALKQAKLNPIRLNNPTEKLDLAEELNLNIRSDGRLEKVLLSLPPPPPPIATPQPSLLKAQSPPTSSSSPTLVKPASDTPSDFSYKQNLKPIDQFVKNYLPPLVWSNPQVDISLIYNKDLTQPKITFWIKQKNLDDGLALEEGEQKKDIVTEEEVIIDDSLDCSQIIQLILKHCHTLKKK